MKKIIVYAYVSPESLTDAGKAAGLPDSACDYFRYAEEFELELDVNEHTGAVTGGRLLI